MEWLGLDSTHKPDDLAAATPRRRWPRWTPIVVLAVITLVIVAVVANRHSPKRSASPQRHSSSAARPSPSTAAPPGATSAARPVVVTNAGHSLLGIAGQWELFGRSADNVLRIQPRIGRVTRTPVPGLDSSGSASFVIGADRVIVHPIDFVPGFAVPDGRPAQVLPPALNNGGTMFPGPDLNHVWIASDPSQDLRLTTLDGRPAGVTIRFPNMFSGSSADGAGYALVGGVGGMYDARPGGLKRVTTGQLLAVGPTRWLAIECDEQAHCADVVIERRTGARRTLEGVTDDNLSPAGVISPDGSTAALLRPDPTTSDGLDVHLLDLTTGADHPLPLLLSQDQDDAIVWSPDGKWLFVSEATGHIAAVDAHDRKIHNLGVNLPPVHHLAIRNTAN